MAVSGTLEVGVVLLARASSIRVEFWAVNVVQTREVEVRRVPSVACYASVELQDTGVSLLSSGESYRRAPFNSGEARLGGGEAACNNKKGEHKPNPQICGQTS